MFLQTPVFTIHQIYAWADMSVAFSNFYPSCTWSICTTAKKMGIQAPTLLSTAIPIPLPSVITSLFPLCATVDEASPSAGKLTAEAGVPSSLILGSSVTLKDDVPVSNAAVIISAAADVFPSNTEASHSILEHLSPIFCCFFCDSNNCFIISLLTQDTSGYSTDR
jgi:hypothetical protein